MKTLMTHMETIISKLQPGFVANFECIANSTINIPPCLHKMVYIRSSPNGLWPIPESFFPDANMTIFVCFKKQTNI